VNSHDGNEDKDCQYFFGSNRMSTAKSNGGEETKLENGVPVPTSKKWGPYPLGKMKIGQSFLLSSDDESERTTVHRCARRLKIRIATRVEGETWRVWRIA
jgi:hypothetical protein